MKTNFLRRSAYWRYVHLRELLTMLKSRAQSLNSPFSIICYGSASYGYNPHCHGKLDDLDLFMIIPSDITLACLTEEIKNLFPDGLEMNERHLEHLLSGKCDICRLYAQFKCARVGFRVIRHEKLRALCSESGCVSPMRNIASIGQSRIVTDKEWSFKSRRYIPVTYENRLEDVGNEKVLLVIQRIFSRRKTRLGPLGRKLLKAFTLYDGRGVRTKACLKKIWTMFVDISRKHCPELSHDQMINSIIRSEKFSKNFRKKLSRIITDVTA